MLPQDAGSGLPLLVEGAVALGLGLFIGLEREHRHVETPDSGTTILGVRTFALLALCGWLSALLEERWPWLPPVLLGLVGLLVLAQYLRESQGGKRLGLTTELAALLTVVFGLMVHVQLQLAVALALVTTVVLISKPWVRVVMPKLMRTELLAALQFLIVVAVVLPLLPTQPLDPWGVLPPRRIGEFVVLVAGVGFVGYVLTRLLGSRRAAGLTGLVGGLVSSTAVTLSMAQRVARDPAARRAAELATLAANGVMGVRVLVIAAIVAPAVARDLAASLGAMTVVLAVAVVLSARAARAAPALDGHADEPLVQNPFALLPALKWGALLCAVLLVSHAAQEALGDAGLLVTGAITGFTDVDSVTLAASRQAEAGTVGTGTAELAILLAVLTNTLVKMGIARFAGGPAFGRTVALGLGLAGAVGLAVALVF